MKNRMKILRAERNWTQDDLAKKCNISRSTINSVENGMVTPNGDTIVKLSKAFNVPANEIFFDLDVV